MLVLVLLAIPLVTGWIGARRLRGLPPVAAEEGAEVTLHVDGRPLTVLAVPTGTVSIRGCHRAGCLPEWMPYPLRFASILADPRIGGRLPIWSYVIVHPEGVFVVDAGATPSFNDEASWDGHRLDGWMVRSFLRLDVEASGTLPARMRARSLDPANVKALVLTHQHLDHTAATPAFDTADVWTAKAEDDSALQIGAMPWRWRDPQTHVRYVDVEGKVGALPFASVPLTKDGRLEVLWTPGHTPGSTSVRLLTDEGELWFVGDATFRVDEMAPDAPTTGMHTNVRTVRSLQAFLSARREAIAILPAHDAEAARRLAALGSP